MKHTTVKCLKEKKRPYQAFKESAAAIVEEDYSDWCHRVSLPDLHLEKILGDRWPSVLVHHSSEQQLELKNLGSQSLALPIREGNILTYDHYCIVHNKEPKLYPGHTALAKLTPYARYRQFT
ncbi:unnamed protein product, partial [Ixodes persulcatus]